MSNFIDRLRKTEYFTLLVIVLSMQVCFTTQVMAAPKTDIVVFKNGDRLTGEIKSLKRGKLHLNTDATGTIEIEWDKIANVVSNQNIQVETGNGTRYFGSILTTEDNATVLVDTEFGPKSLDNKDVVMMSPIEARRTLDALDLEVMLGYNFAKAGGVKQGTFGVDAAYRTRQRIYSVTVSTTVNDSNEQTQSTRSNFGLEYRRLWKNRWYISGNLNLDRNDELGLQLRTSVGASLGRGLIQSNSMLLDMEGGLQFSQENQYDVTEDFDSIEALWTTHWDWFRFDTPELDWSTTFQLIPSITDLGRIRANFDTSLKWEIINDLKWGITFYSTFDNRGAEDASSNDYGVNTNFNYSF